MKKEALQQISRPAPPRRNHAEIAADGGAGPGGEDIARGRMSVRNQRAMIHKDRRLSSVRVAAVNRISVSLILAATCAAILTGCRQENPSQNPPATAALTRDELFRRAVASRAVEAVIWGMPAVNYDLMYQAMVSQTHGDFNQIVYWSKLPSWKSQTLTPNPDAIYVMPFLNTKDAGPMVLEIPPAEGGTIVGSIDDCWQTALEDVGPAGADKSKGGKYLILPPDYKGKPPAGYIVLPSGTYESYALLRSILKSTSDPDVASAVEYAKRIKVYPLSQSAHPADTKWNDAIDVVSGHTCVHSQHVASRPLIPVIRAAEEWRRFGGRLLRSASAGRQRLQLGADRPRRRIRSPLPVIWAAEAIF